MFDITYISIERIEGSPFDDRFGGGRFGEWAGGDGNDYFQPGLGDETFDGGAGIDSIRFDDDQGLFFPTVTGGMTIDLAAQRSSGGGMGTDTIINVENVSGSKFADTISGDAGANDLQGKDGGDTLDGRGGSDSLNGGVGDDILKLGTSSAGDLDTLDGGDDTDRADFSEFGSAVFVDLDYDLPTGIEAWTRDSATLASGTWRGIAEISNVENITGSAFADQLVGDAGRNHLIGGNGDDILEGGLGTDILDGGEGFDTVSYANATGSVYFVGFVGMFSDVDSQHDRLISIERVEGSRFNDGIVGGQRLLGAASIEWAGGEGNDSFRPGAGDETFDGGIGTDSLRFDEDGGAVFPELSGGMTADLAAQTSTGGGMGTNTIISVENVYGSSFADAISGDIGVNDLLGRGGNDTLDGRGGSDSLKGGVGDDILKVSISAEGDLDTLDGGADTDTADFSGFGNAVWVDLDYSGPTGHEAWTRDNSNVTDGTWRAIADLVSVERVIGTSFDDEFRGDAGGNGFSGGGGRDTLIVEAGLDSFDGGAGIDHADFSTYQDAIWVDLAYAHASGIEAWTRGGTDVASGAWRGIADLTDVEIITGTTLSDAVYGDAANNSFTGLQGDDTYFVRGGLDSIDGGAGSDRVNFSLYQTAVWVDLTYTGHTGFEAWTRGGTTVTTGVWKAVADLTDIEHVTGSAFDDIFHGSADRNVFIGGRGSDTAFIEAALDEFDGGAGDDRADFSSFQSAVWIDLSYAGALGFEAWTRGGTTVTSGDWQPIANLTSVENITGTAFDDVFYGGPGNNAFSGGAGADVAFFNAGLDDFSGGAGVDTADFSDYQTAVWIDLSYTHANGFEGWTRGGTNVTSGKWQAIANLTDVEALVGSNFDDAFFDSTASNTFTGGNGNDTFAFKSGFGSDRITDFQDTGSGFEDVLNFAQNTQINSFADITVSILAGNTVLTTADGTITLEGITSGISVDDFVF